jgi:hypothetical protein
MPGSRLASGLITGWTFMQRFDFLGFTFRHRYKSRRQSAYDLL